jgi:hypothetical protein
MSFKIKLFEKKKNHSCCNIKIEEVKAEEQTKSCCHSEKADAEKSK